MHFNCRQALVKEFLSLSVLLLFAFSSIAQNRNYLSGKLAKEKVLFAQKVETEGESKITRVVFEDNVSFDVVRQFSQSLKLSDDLDLKLIEKKVDKYGFEHIKYQQTYKGIEVFGNEFIFHCKGDVVKSANGTLLQKIELETQPTLAEDAALAIAIKKVGAENYMWENSKYEGLLKSETNNASATYYPTAKLGLSRHKFNPDNPLVLVYQLEVYAANPIGRYHIEIDAKTGEIVNFFNKLHNAEATGTGISLYNGEVALDIDFDGSDYFLSETLRGDGIFTYDMMNSSNYSSATLFSESDNLFDEENSRAGVSAHYGAAATYDYFYNNFGRDSYDDGGAAINSYVHFGTNYVNAFWDGSRMTYGDGDGVETTPLVSLDIVGHEITHAVTERSAGLIYAYESGALNESFSDIFGQSVEFETSPSTANWNLADEIFTDGIRMIRSMSDPNSQGDPDTYQGTNWEFGDFDNGGVHINSGVMNYWFYLLVDGGGGTNDNGFDYSVTGIGLSDAQQIAYRNLTIYLTANSQYLDARVGAEQSAIDIFGEGSQQHLSVVDAWNAVGVPTAEPLLAVQEAIDFGSIPIGLTSVYELQISNQGNSLLLVENITSDNSGFIVSDASLSVAATSSEIITVSFTPSELGVVDGSISLESNGGDQVISITGTGVEPPVISIDPTSFTEALFTGGTATQTLNIANTEGGSDLVWSLSINTQLEEPIAPFVQGQGITSGFNNSGQRISSNLNGEFGAIEGEFEEHTSSPANLTCMTIDDDLGIIYAQANSDTRFYSYSISDDSWGELASSPLSSGNNGGAVFLDGKVYTSYTSSSSLGIYDTETDTWDQIATPISTGNIAADENYIYLALGTSFYRMDPTDNSFQELGSSPISFNAWGGLSYYSGYIYGHQGDGGIEFARYNIASNEWEELPSLPSGAVLGSAIDQSTGDYYAYGSYGGTNFYKYDLESSEWSASTIPYFSVNDGGLVYYGGSTDAGIYFIQGESGTGLASFGVSPLSTWLELAEVDGSVSAGSAQGVDIVFDALGMNGGVYEAILELSSNDPSNSFIEIPVTLEVTGAPDILLSETTLDYGAHFIGASIKDSIQIENAGTDLLDITSITVDNSDYLLNSTTLQLSPGESEFLVITYTPLEVEVDNATITITSNDSDEGEVTISLNGEGVEPPIISVEPMSLSEALFSGETSTQSLTIDNSEGGSDLIWSISANNSAIPELVSGSYKAPVVSNEIPYLNDFYINPIKPSRSNPEVLRSIGASTGKLFIADGINNLISQIDTESGSVISSFTPPESIQGGPDGLAFDGEYIYYTSGFGSGAIYKLDLDGTTISSRAFSSLNLDALAHSGEALYGLNYSTKLILELDYESEEVVNTIDIGIGLIGGMTFAGNRGTIFVSNSSSAIYEINIQSQEIINSLVPNGLVYGLGYSNALGILFVANVSNSTVEALDPDTGDLLFDLSIGSFSALASDEAGSAEWLITPTSSGVVAAGSSISIDVSFDATDLYGGSYESILEIESNDPISSLVEIPVTLEVTGVPDILLSSTSIDFGQRFVGSTAKDSILIENEGTDLLEISSLSADNSDYFLNVSEMSLDPGESKFLVITYTPLEVEVDNATIAITSNDVDEGEISVDLTGTSVEPPIISVNPLSLSEELLSGETSEQEIIISNEGSSDLTWTIGNISGVSALFKEFKSNYYTVEHSDSNNSGLASVAPIPMDVLESLSGSVDVLAWTLYADMTIEYPNTINAISQYFTDFTVTTTSTTASSELEALLESKDVFLIPEQEGGSGSFYASLGIEWSEVLNDFIGSGGHIILCGASSGVESLLNSSGLLSLESVSQLSDGTMEVSDIPHGIIEGIPTTISAQNATFSCNVIDVDASILVTLSSKATVVSRELGNGTVSFVGFDFYEYDDDAAQIIANAVSYSTVANWLTTPTTEGVIEAGESETITIEFDATELNGGTYEASINLSSNDPLNPSIDIPVSLDVTGIPDIESENSVSFGEVFIGAEVEETFLVSNVGTEVLNISDVRISNQDFSLDKSSLTLSSGASEEILITYNPEEAELDNTTLTFVSDDPDEGILEIDIFAEGVEPPSISVESSIEIDVVVGNTVEEDLEIENLGGSDLNWSLAIDYTAAQPSGVNNPKLKYMEVGKGQKDTRVGFEVNRGAGGPDVIGYSWVDSDEEIGPDFEWEDISSTGINVTSYLSDDNVAGSFPIGFDFEFYGNSYDEFFISSNGFISFSNDVSSGCCSGQPIPLNDGVNNIIAWAWRDGYPFGNVYYQNFSDKTIIQFDGYGLCCSESSGSATAEIILYADGRIKINYLSLTGSYLDPLSTIGIENEDGTDGLQVAMNTTYLHDNLSILFSQTPEWIVADVTSGSISAGSSALVSLDLGNADLEVGTYNAVISVSSNDPLNGTVEIPVTMNVIEPRYLDLTPNLREVGFEAGQTSFSVETNLSSYNVSSDAEWVSVQKGQDEVILSYEKNESAPRTAVITVSNGPLSEEFALIQEENGDVLGINDPQIRVYPNPTTGRVFIEEEFSDITVTDISGKKVDYSINALPNGSEIDMSKLNTGLYNLVISLKDGSTRSIKILLRK